MPRSRRHLAVATTLAALNAGADSIEELVVTARHDTRTIDVSGELLASPDVAQLLRKAPGANVNSNGPLTGIPQYRGMYGPRIATSLNGNQLAPAGPNWMDPPISYAAGGELESLQLYRGIAPVSVAQESLGGAIDARTRRGEFTQGEGVALDGRVSAGAQSVNRGHHLDTALYASNQRHRIKLAAMTEAGDDADFPGGEITPTEYERQRYDAGYGVRLGDHTLQLDYGYNDTGDTGTPSLPMDIRYIEGDLYNLRYRFAPGPQLELSAALYGSELDHGMSNYHLRQAPAPGLWRRNTASSDNLGFNLRASFSDAAGAWSAGLDGFSERHDSDIDNPNQPMFFVVNFNGAEREVLGLFVERQQEWGERWRGEFGVRYNRVTMDADEVDGTPAAAMPAAQALRDAFNSADRRQADDNIDLVARAWYRAGETASWYAGIAQKHRSPSYQERYLWLPLEATGGLADGYTYTGNIGLKPEVSRQLEFGLDYSGPRLMLSPRLFYNRVDDYIQGTASEVAPAVMFVRMMNDMNGTSSPDPLRFDNVDATLYGADLDWAWQLDARWSLSGIVNYVRGERRDSDDDLYRIAPPNASVRLGYAGAGWSAGVENVLYARQHRVSQVNGEQQTAGYGIVNLDASWQLNGQLQLAAGVANLFDREYSDHLGGYNRAANPDIELRDRLPGYGRNLFARVSYAF
jgi:iron complex outermembrane receptor protein